MPPVIAAPDPDSATFDSALRRELYFFNLYRLLESALLLLFLFGPVSAWIGESRFELLGRAVAIAYLFIAVVLFVLGRRGDIPSIALVGIAADLFFGILAIYSLPPAATGIAIMLLFNIGAAALLVRSRFGLTAAIAGVMLLWVEYVVSLGMPDEIDQRLAELAMLSIGYLGIATLMSVLGRQMRISHSLAERRGAETAHVVEVNELIIRRMRTGVLLVDGSNDVRLANEAALGLLGDAGMGRRNLGVAIPELARRLTTWRLEGRADDNPLQVGPDAPEVVPRFARLLAGSDQTLIFLDDTTLASRRAESMTLATLGRFSASLAHEIRNPLASINYAVQLLEESSGIPIAERRLLEIIRQQGGRMNGIIDNVLGLARREPANPDNIELVEFSRQFIDEYRASHPIEADMLKATGSQPAIQAMFDPRHLHQALTVLLHNALLYGRMPSQPAKVTLRVQLDNDTPVIDVLDRGPGIPERVAAQLFRPFYTTSGHGTGLGLYIARELCQANQATLDYVPLPGGGACFRIRMTPISAGSRER